MALLYETGTWTGSGATPQTITLANASLTPVAIRAWGVGGVPLGVFTGSVAFTMGFGTRRGGSTQSGCVGLFAVDNVATGDTARVRNTTLLHVLSSTSATDYTVSLSSFGAGQFVVTYSSAANASGDVFHYEVWGGDVDDAVVLNWTMDSTGATEVVTGAGFQPDVLLCLDSDLTTANSITAGLGFGYGHASSNSQFGCFSVTGTDADTMTSAMNYNVAIRTDACLERLTTNADTSDARWDLDSFDSDGCTLGVIDAPGTTTRVATLLLMKGGHWEAGGKAKATAAGGDIFTLADTALTPAGVSLFTTRQTAVGIQIDRADFCIGASDGVREGAGGMAMPEAINTTADRFHTVTEAIEELTGGTTPAETSVATSMSLLASDAFTRANNADLGTTWTAQTGQGTFIVASNAATPASNGDAVEQFSGRAWPADQWAQASVTITGTNDQTGIGVMVRGSASANTSYHAIANKKASGNVTVAKFVAGAYTLIAQRTTTWVDGDVLRLEIQGTTLRVYQNGVQLGADMTDSSIASGRPGVCHFSSTTSRSLDNWSAGDFSSAGFRQGAFELNWIVNGGSAALVQYLACGDVTAPAGPPAGSLGLLGVGR